MYKFIKQNISFIILVIFTFYFISTLYSALNKNIEIVYAVILTIPLYFISVHKLALEYKIKKKISLITIFKSTLFLTIPLKFMGHVNFLESDKVIYYVSNIKVNLNDSFYTLLIVLVAFISLDIGSFFVKKVREKKSRFIKIQTKNKSNSLVFLLFTTISILYLNYNGISGYDTDIKYTTGYYSFIRTFSNIINPLILMLTSINVFNNKYKPSEKYLFYILLITQIILGLLSGMKETAIIPIIIYIVFYIDAGKTISNLTITSLLLALIILYPINNNYRNLINSDKYKKFESYQIYVLAVNDLFQSNKFAEIFEKGFQRYSSRSDMYSYLDHSIQNESEWGYYKNMKRYLLIPIYPIIPRFLWKSKPRADAGGEYYKLINNSETTSAVTVSSIGWAYLEGGIIPLILIFTFIGFWLKKYNTIISLKDKVIWTTALLIVIKPEWDPFSMIVGFIQSLILISIVFRAFKLNDKIYISSVT